MSPKGRNRSTNRKVIHKLKSHRQWRWAFCYNTIMPKTTHPEIRIQHAWLLYNNTSVYLHKLLAKDKKIISPVQVSKKVDAYNKSWLKYERKILSGLYKTTGLQFKQNIIDVYIAPYFNGFSNPMVIGVQFPPDYFVDVLTHELLHRLLTDYSKPLKIDSVKQWANLFGKEHSFTTLVHIPVHAFHQAIFQDVLKEPKRLKRELDRLKKYHGRDYLMAWDYVQKHGYKNIIQKLRKLYKIR